MGWRAVHAGKGEQCGRAARQVRSEFQSTGLRVHPRLDSWLRVVYRVLYHVRYHVRYRGQWIVDRAVLIITVSR